MSTLHSRFLTKVDATGDCWLWTGFVDKAGYARIRDDGGKFGEVLYAHRYSYEAHVGPIPEGLTIDHLCRVRRCVNPAHLEAVTHRENVLRGESPGAKARRRKHCLYGHPYDALSAKGHQRCLTCERTWGRASYQRRKAMAA